MNEVMEIINPKFARLHGVLGRDCNSVTLMDMSNENADHDILIEFTRWI